MSILGIMQKNTVYIINKNNRELFVGIYLGDNKFYVLDKLKGYYCADVLNIEENQLKNIDIIVKSALLISVDKSNIIEIDNVNVYGYKINVSKADIELWILKSKLSGVI